MKDSERSEMNGRKTIKKWLSVMMIFAFAMTALTGFSVGEAKAAGGNVYSCTVNRCYAHPVTGVIEDSGGESSYAIGQGMVEGCVYDTGMLEVTDGGAYYLTIRMSLMDFTSGHSFQVQTAGESGWTAVSELGITGNGSDSNGKTADVCMRVPSENCVVRGSMYVEPMGRDVIFYLYPSNFTEGNNTGMKATMVTGASSGGAAPAAAPSGGGSAPAAKSAPSASAPSGSKPATSTPSGGSAPKLQSSITAPAKPSGDDTGGLDTESSTLDSAEGLSLSTAKDGEAAADGDGGGGGSHGSLIFEIALAVVISGLILIGAAAGVVYYFHRNWKRWGGADDDDE